MKNTTTPAVLLLLSLFMLLSSCGKTGPATVLEEHEARYPDIRKKYVYQSLIRLANINQDPNFEKLIRDVKKIVLYLPPRNDSTYQITTVLEDMQDNGYDLLVESRTADNARMSLWVKDQGPKSHYVALMDAEGEDMILEVDGQINIEYLMAIEMADQEALMGLIKEGF